MRCHVCSKVRKVKLAFDNRINTESLESVSDKITYYIIKGRLKVGSSTIIIIIIIIIIVLVIAVVIFLVLLLLLLLLLLL